MPAHVFPVQSMNIFMIEAIRLQRFKGFLDSGWIELKPITLLFGYNSSGKSTILQALLMLKQTLESPAKEIPIIFSGNRVDLGTFYDVAHRHEISDETPIVLSLRVNLKNYLDLLAEQGSVSSNTPESEENGERFLFDELKRNSCVEVSISINYERKKKLNELTGFSLKISERNIFSHSNTSIKKIDWEHFIPKSNEYHHAYVFKYSLFTLLEKSIYDTYQELTNIGPVRAIPLRIQQFTGERPFTVGAEGEDALKILYLSQYNHTFPASLHDNVNAWLASYHYRFQWKMLDENIGQVILTDMRTNLPVNLKDVGFGISQVLPIVIQVHAAPQNSIVLIEQPEIHLHSRAQAELADLFIQAVSAGSASGKRLLIETHSETLLLRLRRRLAEHTLKGDAQSGIAADDIAMYFIENESGQSIAHRIHLNEHGEFVEMPEGFRKFFTDDFEEMMHLHASLAKLKGGEA